MKKLVKPELKSQQNKHELESLIMSCTVMKMTGKESLAYLKKNGKNIKVARFYEIKKNIKDLLITNVYKITSENGLFGQNMFQINTLETREREMWLNYSAESNPSKKSEILACLTNLQVFISSAYDYIHTIIKIQEELQLVISKHNNPVLKKSSNVQFV